MSIRACLAGLLVMIAPLSVWGADAAKKAEIRKDLVYAERDSGPLKADLFMPQGEGTFPAVLLVHGGAWRTGNKSQLNFVANRLAQEGYVVFAINYRLCPTHKWPAQIEDCKSAVRWMRTNAKQSKIDPTRIGGWGYSAGAHLVSLLGTTDASHLLEGKDVDANSPSTRLQCVVAGGTPCDLRLLTEDKQELLDFIGAGVKEKPELYAQASPAFYLSKDDPPMFLYHGDADELVPLISAELMYKSLKEIGIDCELCVVPKAMHVPAALSATATNDGIKFLNRHLKPAQTAAAQ